MFYHAFRQLYTNHKSQSMEPPKDITPEILYQTGMEVFEDFDAYENWLNSEIPNLGGRKPSSLVHTKAGRRACYYVLMAILHGIYL